MLSKVVDTAPLTDAECRSLAPARSRLAYSFAGRARAAWELVTGKSAVVGEEAGTPKNPDGRIGVNRSGPPFGQAFLHPIWHWAGQSSGLTGVDGKRQITSLDTQGDIIRLPIVVLVRNFFKGKASPYSRGYFECRLQANTTGGGGDTAQIQVRTNATTNNSAATAVTTEAREAFGVACYFALEPGLNELMLEIELVSAVRGMIINSATMNQIVKASH